MYARGMVLAQSFPFRGNCAPRCFALTTKTLPHPAHITNSFRVALLKGRLHWKTVCRISIVILERVFNCNLTKQREESIGLPQKTHKDWPAIISHTPRQFYWWPPTTSFTSFNLDLVVRTSTLTSSRRDLILEIYRNPQLNVGDI